MQFVQPDTVGMGNRYAYVNNNPINFNDPSGFIACAEDDYDCINKNGRKAIDYKEWIKNAFGWTISGNFSEEQLGTIYDAGSFIQSKVDDITGEGGYEWIKKNISNVNIHFGGLPAFVVSVANNRSTSVTFPTQDIWLSVDFDTVMIDPLEHIIHEVGHVLDNNLGPSVRSGGPSIWSGGGPSDTLTRYLGGIPNGIRWENGTSGILTKYFWNTTVRRTSYGYGNNSTADNFAECFGWTIVDPSQIRQENVNNWVEHFITLTR
jgi:hypothetical protein